MADNAQAEGTFVIGVRNFIEDVDAAACALLGYSKSELVGLHGSELVLFEDQPSTAASIDRMRHGEVAFRISRLRCKDGSVIGVEVRAQRLPDGRLALSVRKHLGPEG